MSEEEKAIWGFRQRWRNSKVTVVPKEGWYTFASVAGALIIGAPMTEAVVRHSEVSKAYGFAMEYGPIQRITDPPYMFPGGEGQIVKPSEQSDPLRPDLAVGVRVRMRGGTREGVIRQYNHDGSLITAGHLWAVQWDDGARTEHNFSCDLIASSTGTGVISTTFEGFCLLDWCGRAGLLDGKFCSLRCAGFDARRKGLQRIKADTVSRASLPERQFIIPRAEELFTEGMNRLRAEFFALRWAP